MKAEIARVTAVLSAPDRQPPLAPMLVGLEDDKAIWRVTTTTAGDVYMSMRHFKRDELYVVHCDAERFYLAWLHSGDHAIPRSAMPLDRKYERASMGFARACTPTDPVPVAYPGVLERLDARGFPRIAFTDGVTRTYWLLANRAAAFPVRVWGASSAERLHQFAGLGEAPLDVKALFQQRDIDTSRPAP